MQPFVVHSIPGSPFGRAVLMALEEKGASYRVAAVRPGDHRKPEYLARHPFGRVPALEHGDFGLYETQAMLRYVDRVLPGAGLTPADARAAAKMDQLMNISDWYLFQGVGNVIAFQRVIGPKIMGLTPDEAAIAEAMPQGHLVFGQLARMLGEGPYFCGEAITLADIMLASQVDFFTLTPEWEPLAGPHDNLRAWLERMNGRSSMQATTWERVAAMAAG
jgi:glutathione S-transferase